MKITNTYQSTDAAQRLIRQAAICRRCFLLLSRLHQEVRA